MFRMNGRYSHVCISNFGSFDGGFFFILWVCDTFDFVNHKNQNTVKPYENLCSIYRENCSNTAPQYSITSIDNSAMMMMMRWRLDWGLVGEFAFDALCFWKSGIFRFAVQCHKAIRCVREKRPIYDCFFFPLHVGIKRW